MFDSAISAISAYGGMKAFASPGNRVVVKPNIGWDVSHERGGNTNPQFVDRIVEHCFDARANEVIGCGGCEHACPTRPFKAIYVDGNPVHKIAEKPVVEVLTAPLATEEDFPF